MTFQAPGGVSWQPQPQWGGGGGPIGTYQPPPAQPPISPAPMSQFQPIKPGMQQPMGPPAMGGMPGQAPGYGMIGQGPMMQGQERPPWMQAGGGSPFLQLMQAIKAAGYGRDNTPEGWIAGDRQNNMGVLEALGFEMPQKPGAFGPQVNPMALQGRPPGNGLIPPQNPAMLSQVANQARVPLGGMGGGMGAGGFAGGMGGRTRSNMRQR